MPMRSPGKWKRVPFRTAGACKALLGRRICWARADLHRIPMLPDAEGEVIEVRARNLQVDMSGSIDWLFADDLEWVEVHEGDAA